MAVTTNSRDLAGIFMKVHLLTKDKNTTPLIYDARIEIPSQKLVEEVDHRKYAIVEQQTLAFEGSPQ